MYGFNKSYDDMLEELCQGNKIIKGKLNRTTDFENGSEIYGVLNKDWVMNLKELLSKKKAKDKIRFHYNLINPKKEPKRFYLFENKPYNYNFPLNFILVSDKFINLISSHFTIDEQKKIIFQRLYTTYIGGNCIIRKDNRKSHFDYFITLSYDENFNNKVHYILVFKDEEHARNNINLILSNNINLYMEYIGYSDEEIKEIKNDQDQNEIVGYFIRNNHEDSNNNNINNEVENEDEDENENDINIINENNNIDINNGDNLDNDINANNINIMNGNFMLNMFNNMNMNNTINNQANLNSINNLNNFN